MYLTSADQDASRNKSSSDAHNSLDLSSFSSISPSLCEVCGDSVKRIHGGKDVCEACKVSALSNLYKPAVLLL